MAKPQGIIVDTIPFIRAMIDEISSIPSTSTSPDNAYLYVDVEGVKPSRHGSVSILQLFVEPTNTVYLIDTITLGTTAFNTSGLLTPTTLHEILEHADIKKVFFDVRNDSDALHAHFGINLRGVVDLQVMENCTRNAVSKHYLNGLAKCIQNDLNLGFAEKTSWQLAKDRGMKLFAPERGGSYEVFGSRPLLPEIVEYCVADVCYMPKLYNVYKAKMRSEWVDKVERAVRNRVVESHSLGYQPNGEHKKYGPWSGRGS